MTSVSINLIGSEKENIAYLIIATKRWGQNGAAYNVGQEVPAGAQTVKIGYANGKSGEHNGLDVPDQASAVLTVDATDDEVEMWFG